MKYLVEIEGISDMLQNKLSKGLIDEFAEVPKSKQGEWEEKSWKKKLYTKTVNGKEEVVINDIAIYKMMQEACSKYQGKTPKSVGRTWTYYFKGSMLIEQTPVIYGAMIEPFGTMVNGNPSSNKKSSKVYKVRPRIKQGWKAVFTVIDMGGLMDAKTLEGILRAGGMFIGLGDWRPLFGRFSVLKIKEMEV